MEEEKTLKNGATCNNFFFLLLIFLLQGNCQPKTANSQEGKKERYHNIFTIIKLAISFRLQHIFLFIYLFLHLFV